MGQLRLSSHITVLVALSLFQGATVVYNKQNAVLWKESGNCLIWLWLLQEHPSQGHGRTNNVSSPRLLIQLLAEKGLLWRVHMRLVLRGVSLWFSTQENPPPLCKHGGIFQVMIRGMMWATSWYCEYFFWVNARVTWWDPGLLISQCQDVTAKSFPISLSCWIWPSLSPHMAFKH